MRRGRSAQEPLLPVVPNPELAFRNYRQKTKEMAPEVPTAEGMAELRRLLELSQAETIAAHAKTKEAEDLVVATQAAHGALPKNAADYLKLTVRMKASPLVLPAVPAAYRDLRPSLLTLIKTV